MSRCLRVEMLVVGLAAISAAAGSALSQPVPLPACSQGIPRFCADASFFLDGDSGIIEVYLEVCNDALQFVRSAAGYTASADVMILVRDDEGVQVTGDTYRIRLLASSYDQTTSFDSCETRIVRFKAEPGDFTMGISVSDRDTRRTSLLETAISVPGSGVVPALSDLVFLVQEPGREHDRWSGFRPNVKRIYGEPGSPVIFFYELYRRGLWDSLEVIYEVVNEDGRREYESAALADRDSVPGCIETIPVDSLASGTYTLKVSLVGADGEVVAARSKQFEVSTEALYLGRDLDEAVALLYYIADGGFVDRLVKAEAAERRALWEQFWRERDPTPSTPRNEFYEEHLRRFRYANRQFGSSVAEGWRTDRGRIYIMYGPPDEIESRAVEVDQDAMEIWYYFENGRRFVFVDETGFGDYVLVSGP